MTLEQRDLFEVIDWLWQQIAPGTEISALGPLYLPDSLFYSPDQFGAVGLI